MIETKINKTQYIVKLENIFDLMAKGYKSVADHYGFDCKGCEESCCLTLFYHHTLLEYFFLKEGLKSLDDDVLNSVREKAKIYVNKLKDYDQEEPFREMCPLNDDGLCALYNYRPMICRLHGVCHELRKPGQEPLRGPGCSIFSELQKSKEYFPLDRTPFYIELSNLERDLRMETGIGQRLKMTIAQIILD